MVYDSISNIKNYKSMGRIYEALCHLSDENNHKNTVFVENEFFCNIVELTSKPETECVFEAHKKYIDIHFIINGIEVIKTAHSDKLNIITPYNDEKDICFLDGKSESQLILDKNKFVICFPNDAHKVAIMDNVPSEIKKIVFKILVD